MGVQDVAVDPMAGEGEGTLIVLTASSEPVIRVWRVEVEGITEVVTAEGKAESAGTPGGPITVHATSVYALRFDEAGDLWTASADGSVKCLAREHGWSENTTLRPGNGDWVRCIAVSERLVVAAGRDEDVRVWRRGTDDEEEEGNEWVAFEGHWEEVMGVCFVGGGEEVVSVGIDGTMRRWGVRENDVQEYRERLERDRKGVEDEEQRTQKKEGILTTEEEKELEELMGDDSD